MLTKQRVEGAKAKDKPYQLPDTDGLYLRVFPTGTKKWIARMYAGGKAVQKTIGEYPATGLLEALFLPIRNGAQEGAQCLKTLVNAGVFLLSSAATLLWHVGHGHRRRLLNVA